ncbi:MAG: hypothetical protein IPK15_02125 [Verrucomicrobia bacterium]|nr:hypothetical protein [Verrucomicrobiota bacterium]
MPSNVTSRLPAKLRGLLGLWLALALPLSAQEPVNVRSQSGQFLVRGLPLGAPVSGYSTSAVQYLRLDPTLTAVSLERIKQSILGELQLKDQWRGLISITTQPVQEDVPAIHVDSVRFKDGWGYRVEIPERIDKDRFMRAAVKVILAEIANRTALTREAELPPWLAEGFAADLQSTILATLALEPETQVIRRDVRHDPLRNAREVLRRRPALKFDDLCLPTAAMLAPENIELYRACSQVFVHELLRLRTGRDCLRDMLVRLPQNLNWQTTFLQSFNVYFQRLIDVDKWYALSIANVASRDLLSRWPLETSWKQFDEILATQVQVRLEASELPINTSVTLQRIVSEWDDAKQHPVIAEKVNHLLALRPRVALELGELVDAYAEILQKHLAALNPKAKARGGDSVRKISSKTRNVLRRLDELDAQRATLRQQPKPAAESR